MHLEKQRTKLLESSKLLHEHEKAMEDALAKSTDTCKKIKDELDALTENITKLFSNINDVKDNKK